MAFVWSRLALAAVLAVGGAASAAAASTSACPGPCGQRCDDAPRLDCAAESPTLFVDLGDLAVDAPVIAPATFELPPPPRVTVLVLAVEPAPAPIADHDVLAVAPKTSPPRS